jgi:two-component system cell cycle response regulator
MAKIIVLDDEDQWIELVRDKLSGLGHEVRTTTDCLDALGKIKADRPDLVIIDLRMPINGAIMLQTLREDWPDIPVVMHTVFSGYRHDPNLCGMAGFAVKDPELTELVGVVECVLARGRTAASPV